MGNCWQCDTSTQYVSGQTCPAIGSNPWSSWSSSKECANTGSTEYTSEDAAETACYGNDACKGIHKYDVDVAFSATCQAWGNIQACGCSIFGCGCYWYWGPYSYGCTDYYTEARYKTCDSCASSDATLSSKSVKRFTRRNSGWTSS